MTRFLGPGFAVLPFLPLWQARVSATKVRERGRCGWRGCFWTKAGRCGAPDLSEIPRVSRRAIIRFGPLRHHHHDISIEM